MLGKVYIIFTGIENDYCIPVGFGYLILVKVKNNTAKKSVVEEFIFVALYFYEVNWFVDGGVW